MKQAFWVPFLPGLCAGAVTAAGIAVIRRHEEWALGNVPYFACFAAGALVSVSFLHIMPEALSLSTPIYLLADYLSMHLFNRFVTAFVCDRPTTREYAVGLVPMMGMGCIPSSTTASTR
jgi:zinc transporter ZupT